jgi:hypothetical protein
MVAALSMQIQKDNFFLLRRPRWPPLATQIARSPLAASPAASLHDTRALASLVANGDLTPHEVAIQDK